MRRPKSGGSPDYRAPMVVLAEALDRLIVALRRHVEGEPDWLQLLVRHTGELRDLIDADAHLEADDLRDVCRETEALFAGLATEATFARCYGKAIAQRPDLRKAHADCNKALREICPCPP